MFTLPRIWITILLGQLLDLKVFVSVGLINSWLVARILPPVAGGGGRGVRKSFHAESAPEIAANYFFTQEADYRKSIKRVAEIRKVALRVDWSGYNNRADLIKDVGLVKELKLESDMTLLYAAKWLNKKWGSMLTLYEAQLQDDLRKAYRDRNEAALIARQPHEQSPEEKAAQDQIDKIERELKRWRFLMSEISGIFIEIKSANYEGEGELVG